uniref:Conserved domain protein n=1 Tax=Chlamydia pneumoniae TaxID=83558 RepID=A0A0F7X3Y9_CHLPN|nr:Conserved domain protein [Chlamydia pneumoniae]
MIKFSIRCLVMFSMAQTVLGAAEVFVSSEGKKTEVETKEVKIKDEIRPSLEGNDPVKVAESFPKRRAALESLSSQSSIGNLCAISNFLDSQMLSRNFSKEIWGSTIFTRSKSTCDAEGSEPFRYTACGYLAGLRSKLAGSYELGVTAGLLQGRLKDVSDSHRTRATSSILSVHGSMVTRPLSCTKYIVGKARPLLFFFRLTSDVRRDLKKSSDLNFAKIDHNHLYLTCLGDLGVACPILSTDCLPNYSEKASHEVLVYSKFRCISGEPSRLATSGNDTYYSIVSLPIGLRYEVTSPSGRHDFNIDMHVAPKIGAVLSHGTREAKEIPGSSKDYAFFSLTARESLMISEKLAMTFQVSEVIQNCYSQCTKVTKTNLKEQYRHLSHNTGFELSVKSAF